MRLPPHPPVRVRGDTRSTLILPRLHTSGVKTHRHRAPHKNRRTQSSPTSGVRSHSQNHAARAWSVIAFCSATALAPDTWCPAFAAAAAADRRLVATVLHATVPRTASPIEPPTCWPTLSMLDATPASALPTLVSETRDSGTNTRPSPSAVSIIGPSRPPG